MFAPLRVSWCVRGANGYVGAGGSDLVGNGILAENYTPTFPLGKNTAFANDDPTECNPTALC